MCVCVLCVCVLTCVNRVGDTIIPGRVTKVECAGLGYCFDLFIVSLIKLTQRPISAQFDYQPCAMTDTCLTGVN